MNEHERDQERIAILLMIAAALLLAGSIISVGMYFW